MKSNPKLHLCRTNRHVNHDYSKKGVYYITLNTQNSVPYLGEILNNEMILSENGEIVKNELLKIPGYHKRVILDEWIIMPNHLHFIIKLEDYDFDNGISNIDTNVGSIHVGSIHESNLHTKPKSYSTIRRNMLIPKIMGKFQMKTSKQINIQRNTPGQKNWQNDYYDVIIYDKYEYDRIKQYIKDNPKNWKPKK